MWAQMLKKKSNILAVYHAFTAWALTQFRVTIHRFRSNQGGEFTSNDLSGFLHEQGMEQRLTTHDMPEHNRITKSLNQHLLEHVHT